MSRKLIKFNKTEHSIALKVISLENYQQDKFKYNGGIIYHADSKDRKGNVDGKYSIHT